MTAPPGPFRLTIRPCAARESVKTYKGGEDFDIAGIEEEEEEEDEDEEKVEVEEAAAAAAAIKADIGGLPRRS